MQYWEAYIILNTPMGYPKDKVEEAKKLVSINNNCEERIIKKLFNPKKEDTK